MIESLRVTLDEIVLEKPPHLIVYDDVTYGRIEGDEYESISLEYPNGLALIYIREKTGNIAADIHYDGPEIEPPIPNSQSLLLFLKDFCSYTQDVVNGYIRVPDQLTVMKEGNPGLVNLLRKRVEFRLQDRRFVLSFDQDPEKRKNQLNDLANLSSQLRDYLETLLSRQS